MSFTRPQIEALETVIQSIILGERPDTNFAPGTDAWIQMKVWAHLIDGLHLHVAALHRYLMPHKGTDDALDAYAFWLGLPDGAGGFGRIVSSTSSQVDCLRVTTSSGTPTVDQTHELTDSAGTRYKPNESHVFGAAPDTFDFDMVSIDKGTKANIDAAALLVKLTFSSPPAGVDEEATLIVSMRGATDTESNAALRARILSELQNPSISGNASQWRRVIEEVDPGTLDAWIWDQRWNSPNGFGSTDYAATSRGETQSAKLITAAEGTAIDAAVLAQLPVRQQRNSRRLTVVPVTQVMKIVITLDPDAPATKEADWDAETLRPVIATPGYVAGPPIELSADVDLSTEIPDITNGIDAAGKSYHVIVDGSESRIKTYDSGADNKKLTLYTELTGNADNTRNILSGGGVILSTIEDLEAYADSLGPERGPWGANLSGWDDTFRLNYIRKHAIDADDAIQDVVIELPATDIAPTPRVDGSVNMLIPFLIDVYEDKS